jgi:hypothetical protein
MPNEIELTKKYSFEIVKDYCGECGCEDCKVTAGVGFMESECENCGIRAPNGLGILIDIGNRSKEYLHLCQGCIDLITSSSKIKSLLLKKV